MLLAASPVDYRRYSVPIAVAILVAQLLTLSPVYAQGARLVEVRLEPNQTIRQLAERYLGDPDLWPEILRASNVPSVADLADGVVLRVPVDLIAAADRAIDRSVVQIRKANVAGAQLFAPDEIGRAITLHDKALDQRLSREWAASKELALSSYSKATNALAISGARRDETAEALLTDRQGDVEGQKPSDLSWGERKLRAILIEEEKVRTLSASTAQLTFRDASRLRLNANSNAVIQQMRYDPLTKQEDAKVSLVEGDFYALLAGKSERKNFSVEIPGAKAQIQSGDFWVQSGDEGAKFANYDSKPVDIATRSDKVVLGRNEGVVLSNEGEAEARRSVLEPVSLASPPDDGLLHRSSFALDWAALDGAQGYWLEIGADQGFERMIISKFGLAAPQFRIESLPPGAYFWRVAALDAFGLPGQRSDVWRFTVTIDSTPPFLRIDQPADDTITRQSVVAVEGESEPGTAVTVDGQQANMSPDGKYARTVTAREGENVIEIIATDRAGNMTRLARRIRFMPDRSDAVVIDAAIPRDTNGRLLSGNDIISLAGRTKPVSRIEVLGPDCALRGSATSDETGAFRLNADLVTDAETLTIAVTAPSGFRSESKVDVAIDRMRPTIALAEELPRVTASETVFVKGKVTKPQARLTINGRVADVADGAFDEIVNLQKGNNPIELVTTDAVGNSDVARFVVTLDSEPPKLISAQSKPVSGEAGSFITVDIAASDESGLAGTARCTLELGAQTIEGFLQFNPATKSYQGTVPVPRGGAKSAVLKSVDLADAAGNRKVFRLN